MTFQPEWLRMLHTVECHIGQPCRRALIYGGDFDMEREGAQVLGCRMLGAQPG